MLKVKLNFSSPDLQHHRLTTLLLDRGGDLFRIALPTVEADSQGVLFEVENPVVEKQLTHPTEEAASTWGETELPFIGELEATVTYDNTWKVCDAMFKSNQPDGGVNLSGFRLIGTLFDRPITE